MSKKAWLFLSLVFLAAGVIAVFSVLQIKSGELSWLYFAVLTFFATVAQLFKAEAPSHQIYHPNLMFLFTGALILDPALFILQVTIAHLVEWGKERWMHSDHLKVWYLQPFNISMHIILGFVSRFVFYLLLPDNGEIFSTAGLFASIVAASAYVSLNHLMVGEALVLARNISWSESGILEIENLGMDFVMLLMGYIGAVLIRLNIWLVLPVLAPLFLMYQALSIPILKQQVDTDPKTGLWNSKYFRKALSLELNRARRFNRPLTVVMADLDYLRNINNTYGHIAGDAVLIGVANILKDHFREYDVVARFGGEEFSILMAETTTEHAFKRIDTIRKIIEETTFESPATRVGIRVTMSFGVAGLEGSEMIPDEIIHRADIAVYASKTSGRNQTILYTDTMANDLGADAGTTARQ